MSVLPPEAKKAMTAVVAAMGGDDYNYYSDFSTTVATSGRSRIIATFRVVVPQVQRQRATANLQKNISDKYVVNAENNQIDVLIKCFSRHFQFITWFSEVISNIMLCFDIYWE